MGSMRLLWILTCLVISFGCGHFSGPGSFSGPGAYKGQGRYKATQEAPDDSHEEEAPSAYIPSVRGVKKGYLPKGTFSLKWPLNDVRINQAFNPKKKRRPHLGVDFGGGKGTSIFSAHEGLVIYAGRAFRGFGKMVIVEYDDQWASLYAHFDKILVKTGDIVEQGQTLGLMGRTGRATGVHLHFELLHNQRPVDPIPLLNEVRRLVDTEKSDRSPASL